MKALKFFTTSGLAILFLTLAVSVLKVSAQGITTGDANSTTIIDNQINTNDVTICDCTPTPTPTRTEEPTPTPTTAQDTPTPTPTDKPGDNGNGGNNGGDGRSDGRGGQQSDSAQGSTAPAVLGLSTTSGENEILKLISLIPAFILFGLGYRFFKNA